MDNRLLPSRKRPSNSIPRFVSPLVQKTPKSLSSSSPSPPTTNGDVETLNSIHKMTSLLAEAGCTLVNPFGPPCLPSDSNKLRHHLHRLFSSDSSLRSDFLSGFSAYINTSFDNFRRVLIPSQPDNPCSARNQTLIRVLLLVPSIQLDLQNILLEKLPEYFDTNPTCGFGSSFHEDISRLILNQFRWVEFLVDAEKFTDKLLQVLCICPLHLKKEIIGSLPEIIGDQSNMIVVDSLEKMLHEDHSIIVPILDSFSNLNLDDQLQEKVITIALQYLRTTDMEHMPYLLRFLLLSATPKNSQRIISQIREQIIFVGVSSTRMTQRSKLKGKSIVNNSEALILDTLRSSLRFKNILCQEILKEVKTVERAKDHKVIDIWFLVLIYMNSDTMQKNVEKVFKKKIVDNCIQEVMFDQCISGNKELVQDYFSSFLSLTSYLSGCKEQKPRDMATHIFACLFEEFVDTYSRQEILGALVTHVGSGISFEVSSALDAMILLASKYSHQLIPLSCHISGILDYLEGFSIECLHKVYEVFCLLALSSRSCAEPFESSIANELLIIVRKQVNSSDMKYKKVGIIGTLKIVSYLGDANNTSITNSSQKSNYEEALELLKTSLDFCKQLPLPLILLYDELVSTLNCKTLHTSIMEWIGNHVGEFESMFLADLEGGVLPTKDSYCGLEGELWMNLDGEISPICLNILPLVSSSCWSASSLQILPANFQLLSVIERLTSQGSLGGIDALLGCPLHLPSSKIFTEPEWKVLSGKQKQVVILSIYYAENWMRELLNAFTTQVSGRFECVSQTTKEEVVAKLFKRLRNIIYLESLLVKLLKEYHISLPELYPHVDPLSTSISTEIHYSNSYSQKKKQNKKDLKSSANSDINGKCKQPTILDAFRKAGATIPSQEQSNENMSSQSSKCSLYTTNNHDSSKSFELEILEVCEVAKILEGQRYKFRPLSVDCFSILSYPKDLDKCCADPPADLPLHLYLLRDLHSKLDYFIHPVKQNPARIPSTPPGFNQMTAIQFLSKIRQIFPSLKKHLDSAVCVLQGTEICEEHWNAASILAGNPDFAKIIFSDSSVSSSIFQEILYCFSKMVNVPDIQTGKSVLSDILQAFQPTTIPDHVFSGIQTIRSGSIDHLYCGAYSFLEELLDKVNSFSFKLASEVLLALESLLSSFRKFQDKPVEKDSNSERILSTFRNRLGISAKKLLSNDTSNLENDWKGKGEIIQKTLHIYLENCECTSDLLNEIACSILPKVYSCQETIEDESPGFPSLCSSTFVVWYRELHEENLRILNKLVKEIVLSAKPRAGFRVEDIVERLLKKLVQCVTVVVSLINVCKAKPKVNIRAMAVKYGGKFVDSFLKVFQFLETHYQTHNELIIQLVTELQKATRTIQTLCSEAKGLKQTGITSKIPATKRSMERFLFRVKALLHITLNGSHFWMGNLKHKDLSGQIVSSQAYGDGDGDEVGVGDGDGDGDGDEGEEVEEEIEKDGRSEAEE